MTIPDRSRMTDLLVMPPWKRLAGAIAAPTPHVGRVAFIWAFCLGSSSRLGAARALRHGRSSWEKVDRNTAGVRAAPMMTPSISASMGSTIVEVGPAR
jgi:hypothetical protein